MKLDFLQAMQRLPQASGLWLLHGDEPLLGQLLLESLRQQARAQGWDRQRLDIASAADWRQVLDCFGHLSLFGGRQVVEAHGHAKPDAAGLAALTRWLGDSGDGLLVVNLPRQDSAALKGRLFQLAEANGTVVNLTIQHERQRQQILQQQADQLDLQLDQAGWQLLHQQTENNLLAAWQTLQRLHHLLVTDGQADVTAQADTGTQPVTGIQANINAQAGADAQTGASTRSKTVTLDQLNEGLLRQSRFTVFDLADTALQGKPQRSVSILRQLLQTGEPPSLILWALAREMNLLLQLAAQPDAAQSLGIWSSRISTYRAALRRLDLAQMSSWPGQLLQADRAIKGDAVFAIEDMLLQLVLALCGHSLLQPAHQAGFTPATAP